MLLLTIFLLSAAIWLSGYLVGSARTFAACRFGGETIGTMLRTMLPWYGSPRR